MEYYRKKPLYRFKDDEGKKGIQIQSSPQVSKSCVYEHDDELNFHSPTSRSSSTQTASSAAAMYSFLPPSPISQPDSPWTLSPLQTPSPTVLYQCIASLHRQEGIIHSIAVSKELVYTGSESNRIRAWRQPECVERGHVKASSGEVRAILAYGNNMLFTSHKDLKVRIWNIVSTSESFKAKKIITLPKRRRIIRSSTISSIPLLINNYRSSFSSSSSTNSCHQQHKSFVSCMAYYHAEGILYTGSWDRTVKAWRVSDGRCVDSFVAHEDNINSIVINQEDGCVFSCSSDGSVKLWRRVYGQGSHTLTMTLKFQPSPINALALSTSCFLYSGSSDGFINFWEKEKFSSRYNHGGFLQGHRFAVLCLAAIEKLIFSGSEDTTIRVWRREEGSYYHECLAVVEAHRGPVTCLAASLEMEKLMVMGFLIYSAGLDHSFKVWRIKIMPDHHHHHDNKKVAMEFSTTTSTNDMMMKRRFSEFEMSPVLSPSWVERKRQDTLN